MASSIRAIIRTGGIATLLVAVFLLAVVSNAANAAGITGIFTYHYDNLRDGQNLSETSLTPANVNSSSFGKLFSRNVDGNVYAEPLYAAGVQIPNVGPVEAVYVATSHNSVYAFDATGASVKPFWKVSFLDPRHRISSVKTGGLFDVGPETGITGTPVIDPTSNTIYVCAETVERRQFVHRLHALDLSNGAEKFGGPVVISASVPGTGSGSNKSNSLSFIPLYANQRPGLLLNNGVVYVGFASYGDNGPYHGWLIGYDAQTLAQVGAVATTPNGSEGGIWMSAAAPMADKDGSIFVSVGNGTFDVDQGGADYGDAVLKLGKTAGGTFGIIDYFVPFDQLLDSEEDNDLGSTGVVALPDQNTQPSHLAVIGSKEGKIYLLNRDQLGGFHSGDDSQIVQSISQPFTIYSTPAYFNGTVYFGIGGNGLQAFGLTSGRLSEQPISTSRVVFQSLGATPVVSANGSQDGIVWAIANVGRAVLHAFDARDLTVHLYTSDGSKGRDRLSGYVAFTVPTVVNGRVFVGSNKRLTVFGLLKQK